MTMRAKLSVRDARKALRHRVDFQTVGTNRRLGDMALHIINLSAQGFMNEGTIALELGERVELLLPFIGRIDAHLVWQHGHQAGFQFERVIREKDLNQLLADIAERPQAI
nr:PilZ domain-containing protein [Novosphingobium sp. PhB57]